MTDLAEPWLTWARQRPSPRVVHLDSAAAGRCSTEAMQAASAHALAEAELGAYVAEEQAAPVLDAGRTSLAGLLGVPPTGLAFVESASAALATLLSAWPLQPGAAVAVAPTEWGPNLAAFTDHDLHPVELSAHGDGTIDLAALERRLAGDPPALVHLSQLTSHRAVVQPVAAAGRLCRAAGVPLWVDAAQALGHVDTATGADALYGTSRKWLTGPRGVGLLAVDQRWWDVLRIRTPAVSRQSWPSDLPTVQLLESREASVASRIGLAVVVRQHVEIGPSRVWQRLTDVGRLTRETLGDLPAWALADAGNATGAITALRPTAGQDVGEVHDRLLARHGILTTVSGTVRAPLDPDLDQPWLRISPHVDCSGDSLRRLRAALQWRPLSSRPTASSCR